jgi:penicillin-binding protein 1C
MPLNEPLTAYRSGVPHFIPHLSYHLQQQRKDDIIKTNIFLNTQLKTEKLVDDYVRTLRLKNIRNAAVVIIENSTHNVVSLCWFREI